MKREGRNFGRAEPADGDQRPILIVLHQERSSPGKLGQLLQKKGRRLDIRRPPLGDSLPETMAGHAGAIIFGGPMSANDPEPFIKQEIDWINVPLNEQAPFLGICLGAQMLAKTLGARVETHGNGCAEVGFYPLEATEHGLNLTAWPDMVYQWHREGFDIPDGARLLARGTLFENQAMSYDDTAIGIQFHSELTYAMACRWTVHGEERMYMPGAQGRAQHLTGWFQHDPAVRQWLDQFLDRWLALDKRSQSDFSKKSAA